MKRNTLKICDAVIQPGEVISLALPLPEMFSCAPFYMPIKVAHGKKDGPCLLITAATHGNEFNGTEIINRLFQHKRLKHLEGTVIAVPVMNVYGLINRSRYLPGGIDLDRCFPGKAHGSHADRLAHLFATEILNVSDICVDLRSGFINHTNLPQIYVHESDEQAKKLANAFNAPVISYFNQSEKGSLRSVVFKQKKPFLMYEAAEAMRFDEHAIKVGLNGILNVMKALNMLPEASNKKETLLKSFITEENLWIYASTSGVSHTKHKLGQHIQQGDTICVIKDPFGASEDIIVSSPVEGVIVGKNNLPLVHEGERLFQLAAFNKMRHAASHLENWKAVSSQQFLASD